MADKYCTFKISALCYLHSHIEELHPRFPIIFIRSY